jgi:hypothetical protein
MSDIGIGGGGVLNVDRPANYYKVIDQRKVDAGAKSSEGLKSQSVNFNRFGKMVEARKSIHNRSVSNEVSNSRAEKIRSALNLQVAKMDASVKPTKVDMDALIKTSGLTSDQVSEFLGNNVRNKISSVKAPAVQGRGKDGTNLALKKLAKEMEVQIMGIFYELMDSARDVNPEGGFGEQLFRGQYLTEVVKGSSGEELGEIGLAVYRSLVKEDKIKNIGDVK